MGQNNIKLKPFIKKLKNNHGFYVYDVNSNRILKISEIVYDCLEFFGWLDDAHIEKKLSSQYRVEDVRIALKKLHKLKKAENLFSGNRINKLSRNHRPNQVAKKLNSQCEHLILEITQSCNMDCRYCSYSGHYYFNRKHSNMSLDINTAKKAIDWFFAHSNEAVSPSVGFYGGEPLLESTLIKDIVKYINGHRDRREDLLFSMTTNGTLLNQKIQDFLVKNNVLLLVSLDGPRHIHDKHRRTIGGKGTFDIIMNNLREFKNRYPDYYNERMGISVVVSSSARYMKIYRFFEDHPELFDSVRFNIAALSLQYSDMKPESFDFDDGSQIRNLWDLTVDQMKRGLRQVHPFLQNLFFRRILRFHRRPLEFLGDFSFPNGCCIPGHQRVFVKADGTMAVCERVTDDFKIGDVDHGIDIPGIMALEDKYCRQNIASCQECFALRFCSLCYANENNSTMLSEEKKYLCQDIRQSIEMGLTWYLELLEDDTGIIEEIEKIQL